jgi:hypothetical protein
VRSARALLSFVAATAVVACGGLLGFSDDEEDTPSPPPTADRGLDANAPIGEDATTAEGGSDDADLGDVAIVIPPIDASVDSAAPADQLFPRLATFESAKLTGPDGADVDNGMSLAAGLKGTYAAQSKTANTSIGFTFASMPTDEIYAVFTFRFDTANATQTLAPFFGLTLAGGGSIGAVVQSDGDIYVLGSGTPTKIANVPVGAVKRFGIHARVSPVALEAVVAPDGPFTGAVPINVPWASPDKVVGASLGALSNSAMRVTVDQIGFTQTGFEK